MLKSTLLALALLLPLAAPAAETEVKPPPEVEQELRDRIDAFYGLFRAARFRAAEEFMTEESKEAYYIVRKTRIFGHEIKQITWGDDFETAEVFVTVKQIQPMLGSKPLWVPLVGTWRKLDGTWYTHIAKTANEECIMTPSGQMCFDRELSDGAADLAAPVDVESLGAMIEVDRQEFVLPSQTDEPYSVAMTITNGAKGSLTLEPVVTALPPNVRYSADKIKIPQGEQGVVTITVDPSDKPIVGRHKISFTVIPIFKSIDVKLRFVANSNGLTPPVDAVAVPE